MLQKIKLALRITSDAFNDEILALIEACKHDLKMSGVDSIEESDPLIVFAVTLFVKAYFWDNSDSEKFQKTYTTLKHSLRWRVVTDAIQ